MTVELKPVQSSNISAVGYDPATKVLTVQFHGDTCWEYQDVESYQYEEMMQAKSLGSYFAASIKSQHKAVRVVL